MPKVVRSAPSSGRSSPAPNPRDCLSSEPPRAKARFLNSLSRSHVALAIQSHETQCARLPQGLSPRVPRVQGGPR